MIHPAWHFAWCTLKTLETPLDCREIKPVSPKGNQSWIFIGRTDAEAETPILWPPDGKNWLTGKDPDAGEDWRQEEKGTTEDEMVGWHHRLSGHEFWDDEGQRSLVCCSSWGCKELDTTEQLNWTELLWDTMNAVQSILTKTRVSVAQEKEGRLRGRGEEATTFRTLLLFIHRSSHQMHIYICKCIWGSYNADFSCYFFHFKLSLLDHHLKIGFGVKVPGGSCLQMQETWIKSLDQEDPVEEGMATHSSVLAWRVLMDRGAWWATFYGVEKELDMTEQLTQMFFPKL